MTASKTRRPARGASRKPARKTPWIPILLVLAAGIAATLAWPYVNPAPEVVRPTGDLEPAVEALLTPRLAAAAATPRDAAVHADLGMAYEANGLWPEARASYAQAVDLDARPAWRLHLAITSRQAGDADAALETLRDLAADAPEYAPAQQYLGEALLEAGDLDGAEAAFRSGIALTPSQPYAYVGLGDVLIQRGRHADAAQVLEQAIRLEDDYRRAHFLLGTAYTRLGREAEGDIELQRGVGAVPAYQPDELKPQITAYTVNLTGRLTLAGAYLDGGNPSEAVRLLEETYRTNASNVMLLNTLGSGYLRMRRFDDAERLLKRAMPLDTTTFVTPLNLYNWALYQGRPAEALRYADMAVARAPERDNTHLARAQALTELGRLDEALASADRARELAPGTAQNHGLSGDICYKLKRYEEARAHFSRAVALEPGLFPVWIGLAQSNWELGDPEAARAALAEAHRLAPNHRLVDELTARFAAR
ncbi:MAG: tetratricopeptide repeat protein [Rhodothermales bacterium]